MPAMTTRSSIRPLLGLAPLGSPRRGIAATPAALHGGPGVAEGRSARGRRPGRTGRAWWCREPGSAPSDRARPGRSWPGRQWWRWPTTAAPADPTEGATSPRADPVGPAADTVCWACGSGSRPGAARCPPAPDRMAASGCRPGSPTATRRAPGGAGRRPRRWSAGDGRVRGDPADHHPTRADRHPGAGADDVRLDSYVVEALSWKHCGAVRRQRVPAQSRAASDLLTAIRVVADGDALLDPKVTRQLIADFLRRDPARPPDHCADDALGGLTEREREVLVTVAPGLSNAEIASLLTVSYATAKTTSATC